jgi:aspartate carbamoyltransferase catalytic subunit
MSRHLLTVRDMGAEALGRLLLSTDTFAEVATRRIPKVPALRGRTVAHLFFEDSTRTRLSFETAARRLSADVLTFTAKTSSLNKGESLRDTVLTVSAMGVDAFVVRHASSGVPTQVARWVEENGSGEAVVNAGDGAHAHPTQALLDCYTIRQHRKEVADRAYEPASTWFDGLSVVIVGDARHSRVSRSNVEAFTALGAKVTLVGPPTLLPVDTEGWGVEVAHDLDAALEGADVVYLLRMQLERQREARVPSLLEYTARWGLTAERASRLSADALIMAPGPINRGVEIASDVADLPRSVITDQVTNGVATRMAVLFDLWILGEGGPPPDAPSRRHSGADEAVGPAEPALGRMGSER